MAGNAWRGADGPMHIRRPINPHPTAPAFLEAARQMGMPILDDVNGPMVPGAGYINMNIAVDGTRVSAARAFLHPALSRPNLTLLLNTQVVKVTRLLTRWDSPTISWTFRQTPIALSLRCTIQTDSRARPA